ncbi:MAG: hypothetical protein AB7U41_06750 [Dongiaceae bacterium]
MKFPRISARARRSAALSFMAALIGGKSSGLLSPQPPQQPPLLIDATFLPADTDTGYTAVMACPSHAPIGPVQVIIIEGVKTEDLPSPSTPVQLTANSRTR